MNGSLCSIDWVKVAHVLQALLTPAIGIATVRIGVIATKIQRQQTETSRLQYRLALLERRMKVFDATLALIALVIRDGLVNTMEPLYQLERDTGEHRLLFGAEIGEYIDELWKKGLGLYTIWAAGLQDIIRQEDVPKMTEIQLWFGGQTAVAQEKFLKYIDFREP